MKVSVSGIVGSGKSTIAKILAKKLSYNHYSVGDFMREIARKKGIHLSELSKIAEQGREIDEELDDMQRNLDDKDSNFIIDSRLGFHFIPSSYKIFLAVDIDEAARRIYNASRGEESYSDIDECKVHLERRIHSEKLRYKQYYDIDFPNLDEFDLVIDTTSKTPETIVSEILDKMISGILDESR